MTTHTEKTLCGGWETAHISPLNPTFSSEANFTIKIYQCIHEIAPLSSGPSAPNLILWSNQVSFFFFFIYTFSSYLIYVSRYHSHFNTPTPMRSLFGGKQLFSYKNIENKENSKIEIKSYIYQILFLCIGLVTLLFFLLRTM